VPRGRRLVVLGDGGGHGVVAADVATRHGLELPLLTPGLVAELTTVLPETATTQNPVDFAGGGEQDIRTFEQVVRLLLDSGEADALLVTGYFGGYGTAEEREVAVALASAAERSGVPLVVHSLHPESDAARALISSGALVYLEIEAAVRALAALAELAERAPRGIPAAVTGDALPPAEEGYFASRRLVSEAGVPMVDARAVATADEAQAAAEELGYPVALKALASEHKSDAGGVVLGIADAAGLDAAYRGIPAGACSVERMAPRGEGIELIVGVRRDPRFGAILLIGLGGVYAEVFRDMAVALAPVEPGEAEQLVRSLRCAPLLEGARGRPVLDVAAAARAASALSHLAARAPWLAELEVNPLLVTADGALGLDARLVLGTMEERP
jgi:acetate---CoA ligase (ADP-forming)